MQNKNFKVGDRVTINEKISGVSEESSSFLLSRGDQVLVLENPFGEFTKVETTTGIKGTVPTKVLQYNNSNTRPRQNTRTTLQLIACKKRNTKIVGLIQSYQQKLGGHITETLQSLQTVQVMITRFIDYGQIVEDFAASQQLYTLFAELEKLFYDLHTKKELERVLKNKRLRKKLDTLVSSICIHVNQLEKDLTKTKGPLPSTPTLRKSFSITPEMLRVVEQEEREREKQFAKEMEELTLDIPCVLDEFDDKKKNASEILEEIGRRYSVDSRDPNSTLLKAEGQAVVDGIKMWNNLFGKECFVMEWNQFVNGLGIQISPEDEKHFRNILDNSKTGSVTCYRFSEFLKGFGPLQNCISNVRKVSQAPWFFGYLSSSESKKLLLDGQSKGTFLIRFSSSNPGTFVLEFVEQSPNNQFCVRSVLVRFHEKGFCIHEGQNKTMKIYSTLEDFIKFYQSQHILTKPLSSPILQCIWFHGDIEAEEAKELLKDLPSGTFLVRFSSQAGNYALSFVDSFKEVKKELITCLAQRYQLNGQGDSFSSVLELINQLISRGILSTGLAH